MADSDRVSNGKWSKTMQENDGARDNGYYRGNRRGGGGNIGGAGGSKPNLKLYRPGDGPLRRKTGPQDDECDNNNMAEDSHSPNREDGSKSSGRGGNWRKPSQQLYQPPVSSRESTPGPSDIKFLSEKVSLLSTSPSENHFTDDRKKSKKPEQPIYVPKARAQALASEHSGDSDGASGSHARSGSNKSRCDREEASGNRNRHEQSSKGSRVNLSEHYQKSNKPEPLMQAKFDDKRGTGKTENSHSKWDPPPSSMSKSDTWEQPIKGSKNDLWERGKSREDYGDWRKPSREAGGGKGGRSGSDVGRSKRFSGNRRNNQQSEEGVRWRTGSPLSNSSGMYRSESITGLSPSREIRQTSEPRSLPIDPSRHLRDTRSVEPQQPPPLPAMPPKPPTGRRGRDSKQVKSNLPPRFQKKAEMAANTTSDDWDGSKSLMFQGNAHTLPHSGSRGRGRHRHDDRGDVGHGAHFTPAPSDTRNTRSLTPDQFKRPRTPPSLHHRAPSPKGRRTPDHHRNATPPGYPRRTPSQENLWPKGGRRTPRSQSPAQARDEMRRAPSQENVSRRHGGRRNASPHQSQRGAPHNQDHGRYRHRSDSNSHDNDPFYRNRRMSDSRPPVPLHGQRRPSLGADDHKPSTSERQPQGAKQEDISLPFISIPVIKDWSEEVEESERLQEAEAAASSSESGMQRHLSGSDSSRRKKKKKRRGGDSRGGDEKDVSRKSTSSNDVHDTSSESASVISNKSPANHQHHPPASGPHRGGIIILPPQATETSPNFIPPHMMSHPLSSHPHQQHQQRALFDPSNPNKPILVMAGGMRVTHPGHPQFAQFNHPSTDMPPRPAGPFNNQMPPSFPPSPFAHGFPQKLPIGSDVNAPYAAADSMMGARPNWYDHYSDSFRACHNPHLLIDMERADWDLACILGTMGPLPRWGNVSSIRQFLMKSLHTLLMSELRFCQVENVEQHVWKVVFYNVIEMLRKGAADDPNTERRASHKQTLLAVLEEGVAYFESLLEALQQTFKFSLDHLTGPNAPPFTPHGNKEAPFANLAIISAQKVCLFLGDLARYKDQASDTPSSTYSKARQWYTKAQILNPKNGRPYNQLAILALYARRKLDAVYFYMRSLMASNPFQTARESLLALFDENRKKFESLEKRRREERSAEARDRQREKEALGRGFRREIWVHPDNGQREWRTTSNREKSPDARDEELARMPLPEVNRQFVTSYLHVQGKLFTKVGMETFQEAAVQMLREFRALLQHSPVPVSCTRFLQLLALNMFAIENTQLRDTDLEPGYRSAMQESALVMSLQMFNLILERCASLFPEPSTSIPAAPPQPIEVSEDLQTLLPAVKVWCDWLLCHKSVWNPPPSCADYCVGPAGDAWNRLAKLVNQLERLDLSAVEFACEDIEGFELVKLPEDAALAGFTPLMYNIQELVYAKEDSDQDLAQNCLRVKKVQFFGTVFLCGVDPPVLKLQRFDNERSLYVSVVQDNNSSSGSSSAANTSRRQSSENLLETGDDDRPGENGTGSSSRTTCSPSEATPSDIRNLLNRKEELTRTHQTQERHRQQVQAILEQQAAAGGVEVEVRPRLLVADTNCFIDHLAALQRLLTHAYSLMVPLVVLHELEGLSKGGKSPSTPATAVGPESLRHAQHVAECATAALTFVKGRHTGLRCVTTRGTVLASANFTLEEDTGDQDAKNDDRILNTCVSLIKSNPRGEEPSTPTEAAGERRHLFREVVLLTEDRNLRVKALARDVPVRDLPDFLAWAKLK